MKNCIEVEVNERRFLVPSIGSIWRHKSGNEYRVLMVTNLYATKKEYPPTVVYESVNFDVDFEDKYWSRPLSTWRDSMAQMGD